MAEATHLLGLPLKHKKQDISDFAHGSDHSSGSTDEVSVAGCTGSIVSSNYPATLSGKQRVIKIRDHAGACWYISGSAFDTYSAPSAPNPLNALTWTMGGSSISWNTGYLSSGAAQNFVNLSQGQSYSYIVNVTKSITGSTSNTTRFSQADSGSLVANVNASVIDTFGLLADFTESERETYQTDLPKNSASAKIRVLGVGMYNNYPPYQTGSATVNCLTTDLLTGENKIQLIHTGSDNVAIGSGSLQFFNDTGSAVGINTPTVTENTLSSGKYLSGVRYYYISDIFNFLFTGSRIFETTFKSQPASVTCTNFAIANYNVNYSDSTEAWDVATPAKVPPITGSFTYNSAKTVATAGVINHSPSISVTVSDPVGNSATASSSTSTKWLINTYVGSGSGTTSTAKSESFVDEWWRLPSGSYDTVPTAITGSFAFASVLADHDACVTGALVYPSGSAFNFASGYRPTQTTDYSGHSGSQMFFRCFSGSTSINQGTLTIGGITAADFQTGSGTPWINAKINLKIPGKTAWLDLGGAFNAATFDYTIEDCGCLLSQSGTTYTWNTGTAYTGDGGKMYILRIQLFTGSSTSYNTKRITSLSEASM